MKRILTLLFLLPPLISFAQVENASLIHNKKQMDVALDLRLDKQLAAGTKVLVLTPRIVGAQDTLGLKPVGIYLKDKHYHLLSGLGVVERNDIYGAEDLPASLSYRTSVPYERWMKDAKLELVTSYEGCCGDRGVERVDSLVAWVEPPIQFHPDPICVTPPAQPKLRSVTGSASVSFASGSAKVNPGLKGNAAQLDKIHASVEALRGDPDLTVRRIWLQGSASPEGKYASNEQLARSRTQALCDYVASRLDLPSELYETDYIAENWEDLRAYVSASSLKDREALLGIIDSDAAPDTKEQQIRSKHAASWKIISKECLPELRRTNCRVDYEIRSYADPQEAVRVLAVAPERLTLSEFHTAAQAYRPGSEEFTKAYEEALRFFPEDEAANINAANAAISAGDYDRARALLAKAGTSAEAAYARGTLEASQGNYEAAVPHFREAYAGGIAKAGAILEEIDR